MSSDPQEILQFSHTASESAQRRQSHPGGGKYLDGDLGMEADDSLGILKDDEAANVWKDRSAPAENWKQLRKKRKADKEKRKNAWLYS